jgi:PAS domain S-box-containing protein
MSRTPIFVKDSAFRFVLVNQAFCELVRYSREEVLGKTDFDLFDRGESEFFRAKDLEVFQTRKPISIDEEFITVADSGRRVLSTKKVPLFCPRGSVAYLVGIIHDITRLKQAEEGLRVANEELEKRVHARTMDLEKLHEELIRKERLAVLGQLAGGVAHQIRNPLASMANATSLLRAALTQGNEAHARQATEVIEEEVWRANRTITDLLDYARVRPAVRRAALLSTVVDEALQSEPPPPCAGGVGGVRVVREQTSVPCVAIDKEHLRGALVNLIRNAYDAMPHGGTLTIALDAHDGGCTIRVSDTGKGLAPEVRERLFEPLVTTKPMGLGLGLTTARALVRHLGGTLSWVDDGKPGATFVITLPLTPP